MKYDRGEGKARQGDLYLFFFSLLLSGHGSPCESRHLTSHCVVTPLTALHSLTATRWDRIGEDRLDYSISYHPSYTSISLQFVDYVSRLVPGMMVHLAVPAVVV